MGRVSKFTVGDRVYWVDVDIDEPPIEPDCGTVTGVSRRLRGIEYTVQFDEQDSAPSTLYDEYELHLYSQEGAE